MNDNEIKEKPEFPKWLVFMIGFEIGLIVGAGIMGWILFKLYDLHGI